MTDRELIDYCEAQSQTPRGMISGEMVSRLHELAGQHGAARIARSQGWWTLPSEHVSIVCNLARSCMKAVGVSDSAEKGKA